MLSAGWAWTKERDHHMTRIARVLAPVAAIGMLSAVAACGSDTETVTERTVIQEQPQTVQTKTTTRTVEED